MYIFDISFHLSSIILFYIQAFVGWSTLIFNIVNDVQQFEFTLLQSNKTLEYQMANWNDSKKTTTTTTTTTCYSKSKGKICI